MVDQELTRKNITYQINGLKRQLMQIRDILMVTYMDIPVKYFFELKGNVPEHKDDRIKYMDFILSFIDLKFYKDAQEQIYETKDNELAIKFCDLDLYIWQLIVLTTRFEDKDELVGRIGKVTSELLHLVYFLKEEQLGKDFFVFEEKKLVKTYLLLEQYADEGLGKQYAGWVQLEDASKKCDEQQKRLDIELYKQQLANCDKFEPKRALDSETIKELYDYLGHYIAIKTTGETVIDTLKISLRQFEKALWYGNYTGFKVVGHDKKLHFFINHFSKAYIKETELYRTRADLTLCHKEFTLDHYKKDDKFAEGLQKILPLLQYNDT